MSVDTDIPSGVSYSTFFSLFGVKQNTYLVGPYKHIRPLSTTDVLSSKVYTGRFVTFPFEKGRLSRRSPLGRVSKTFLHRVSFFVYV